jgi:hypothetical protein
MISKADSGCVFGETQRRRIRREADNRRHYEFHVIQHPTAYYPRTIGPVARGAKSTAHNPCLYEASLVSYVLYSLATEKKDTERPLHQLPRYYS